jgi:hypothetical protein
VESPGYLTAKQGDFHALYDYRGRAAYYIKLGDRTVYDLTGARVQDRERLVAAPRWRRRSVFWRFGHRWRTESGL